MTRTRGGRTALAVTFWAAALVAIAEPTPLWLTAICAVVMLATGLPLTGKDHQ